MIFLMYFMSNLFIQQHYLNIVFFSSFFYKIVIYTHFTTIKQRLSVFGTIINMRKRKSWENAVEILRSRRKFCRLINKKPKELVMTYLGFYSSRYINVEKLSDSLILENQ